ncbi:ribulose-phosphate 3-epimerase [Thermoanaerobacter sp. RKWS2]|uniref:ribulose-phosphate 3-epimerase n=1 Tax=Thermoanaerobacter sp. RKWS2 TaxID=2983842 RepID=UPI00224B4FFA|nr:ribulose-phosphate 3-epimerase [Thermoanaerobacter sp. RKWS2]UZQ83192.1 ribulose-phosphate 3-epimerase [Thermoanaerobacter sp. RKWS2]
MVKFAASIICANQLELKQELQKLENAHIDMLHCDIMDGVFVNNLGMGPYVIEQIKEYTKIPLDLHFATVDPEKFIKLFLYIKPEYISFHAETTEDYCKIINLIKGSGIKASIAISPETSVNVIKDVLKDIDMILMMTVNPGFAGQVFRKDVLGKIRQVKEICKKNNNNNPLIEVDGNINEKTIPDVINAGADVLVLGTSSIFNNKINDYSHYVKKIKDSINQILQTQAADK